MTLVATSVYSERRQRARDLGARYDFAQEPLRLYLALVDAQERAGKTADTYTVDHSAQSFVFDRQGRVRLIIEAKL